MANQTVDAPDANAYATIKTIAIGLFDAHVVSANISQLLLARATKSDLYPLIKWLAISSVGLQVLIMILLGILFYSKVEPSTDPAGNASPLISTRMRVLNAFVTTLVALSLILNVVLGGMASAASGSVK